MRAHRSTRYLFLLYVLLSFALPLSLRAQTVSRFTYDENGNRMTATNQARVASTRVFSFQPEVVKAGGRVNIYGVNFTYQNAGAFAATINGSAASIVSVSPTVITIEVPAGVESGPVEVTIPGVGTVLIGDLQIVDVGVTPAIVEVLYEEIVQFTANLVGTADDEVVWSVDGIEGGNARAGTITVNGLYTAPTAGNALEFPYLVDARSVATGRRGFAAVRTGCTDTSPIAYGESILGSMSGPNERFCYEFQGQAGDQIIVVYAGLPRARKLAVRDANGNVLESAIGNQVSLTIPFVEIPEDGTYRIELESSTDAGDFGVGLHRIGEDAEEIPLNTPTARRIDAIGQVDTYTFNGIAGSAVTVDFSTPNVGGLPDVMAKLELVSPSGATVAETNPNSCVFTSHRLDTVALDESGVWQVRVRNSERWNCRGGGLAPLTGDYTLSVCPSNGAPTGIAYGGVVEGSFSADCQLFNFDFAGAAGDIVSLFYVGPANARRMRLVRLSDGSELGTTGAGVSLAIRDVTLPATETYRVTVESQNDAALAMFGFALTRLGDNVTPIALNTPTAGSFSQLGEVQSYTFNGVAGSAVTVDFSTPNVGLPDVMAKLELVSPSGATVAETNPNACVFTSHRLDTVALDESGVWEVRVRTHERWNCRGGGLAPLTGDYTLSVCPSNGAPTGIAYGGVVEGSFSADCQLFNFDFAGAAGDIVSLFYVGPANARRMRLVRLSDGSELGTTGAGVSLAIRDVTLPATETYRVTVESQNDAALAMFGFALTRLGDNVTPIALNTPTAGSFSQLGEVQSYTFNGVAGSAVTVDFSTPNVGLPDVMAKLELVSPSGATVAETNPNACVFTSHRLDTVALDESGVWEVRVRTHERWNCRGGGLAPLTGDYTLSVCPSNGAPTGIAYGGVVEGSFSADCQLFNFDFAGAAGDIVSLFYVGPANARRMRLVRLSDGSELGATGAGVSLAIRDVTLPATETYRVTVESQNDAALAMFGFALTRLGDNVTPIALNTPTAGSFSQLGEVQSYTFNGVAGSAVTVDFSTPNVGLPDVMAKLELVSPSGATVAETNPNACVFTSHRLDTVALDESGVWEVRVRTHERWNCRGGGLAPLTGDYTLSVCPSNGAPTGIAYGGVVEGSFSADCQLFNFDFAGAAGDIVSLFYVGPANARRMRLVRLSDGSELGATGAGVSLAIRDVTLPATETYRVTVESQNDAALAMFGFALTRLGDNVTPIALNTPTAGSFSQLGEVQSYTFNGVAGSAVTVDFSTPNVGLPDVMAKLELVSPSGATVAETNPNACVFTSHRLDTVALDESGVWEVRVRTHERWNCRGGGLAPLTGDYTLSVCPSNGAPTGIAYGGVVEGSFSADCQLFNFDFAGAAGDIASLFYVGPANARRMRLVRLSDGSELGATGAGVSLAIRDVTLPATETYRVTVESQNDAALAMFGFALTRLGENVTPIALNTPTAGSFSQLGEVASYTFNGIAGSAVTVDFSTPNVGGLPDVMAKLELVSPSGVTTAETNPNSCVFLTHGLGSVELTESGQWSIRVRIHERWNCRGTTLDVLTGDYTLTASVASGAGGQLRAAATRFVRGDVDQDGAVQLTDAVMLLDYLFQSSGSPPLCDKAADANDDGLVNLSDAIRILNSRFGSGVLPSPADGCGRDPTNDELDCVKYLRCQ